MNTVADLTLDDEDRRVVVNGNVVGRLVHTTHPAVHSGWLLCVAGPDRDWAFTILAADDTVEEVL